MSLTKEVITMHMHTAAAGKKCCSTYYWCLYQYLKQDLWSLVFTLIHTYTPRVYFQFSHCIAFYRTTAKFYFHASAQRTVYRAEQ